VADENTLEIKIEDTTRENPLLDEFMKDGAPPPPLPKGQAAGGSASAASASTQGGPNFPATVLGPDGKAYSWDAFQAAQKKFQGQQRGAEAGTAYDAFFGPPPLPRGPEAPKSEGGLGGLEKLIGQLGGGKILGAFRGLGGAGGAGGTAGGAAAAGEAGAATAGGAAAGLAAVAGPIGLAILAAQKMTSTFNDVTKAVHDFGDATVKMVGNEMPDFRGKIDDMADGLGKAVPILGDLVGAEIKAANAIGGLPERLTAAFIARAHELAPVSGAITGAEARSEVRGTLADVREAQELGPAMARMIDAEMDLKLEFRQLILPIKKFVVEVLADRLELIVRLVKIAENFPTIFEKSIDTLGQVIVFAATGQTDEMSRSVKLLRQDLERLLGKKEDPKDMFDQFFAMLDAPAGTGGRADPNDSFGAFNRAL
jgi:hypothetical protein